MPIQNCGTKHMCIHEVAEKSKANFQRKCFAAKLYYTAAQGGSRGGRPAIVIMPSVSMLTTWSLEALAVSLAFGSVASGRIPLQADITSLRRTCACTHPSLAHCQGCTSLGRHVTLVITSHTVITAMYQAQTGTCYCTANKCCCPLARCKDS